tara:strand:- start:788 stop:1087 length:300 start_codon:yes stop_codon:yes gene_type:complete
MAKKLMRGTDGLYHKNGKTYKKNRGSRPEVMHGNAYQTTGELLKKDLMYNKHKRIVSRKKHVKAKKEKRLEKAGYYTKKGQFGYVKKEGKTRKNKRGRK